MVSHPIGPQHWYLLPLIIKYWWVYEDFINDFYHFYETWKSKMTGIHSINIIHSEAVRTIKTQNMKIFELQFWDKSLVIPYTLGH